ncbi:helix-turn-helix domain-containing protein [Xanthomonas arboricola]|uniref:AraC-like ligand-binding domain-containing protein n=1 Tax=Xanthomonas arboricola TaxID=56448 RepID=UPI002158368F|nr:helix-turn-helix domain-containing protein [Xanthomonas arboricola]
MPAANPQEVNAIDTTQYSTAAVAAPRRFEYWKEVVCRHCIPATSKPLAGQDFDAHLQVRPMGPLDLCSLSAPLHYWERTPRHLRSGPDEDLWLGFTEHGYGQLEQGGRRTALAADNLVLYDAAQTFRFRLGGHDNHLLRIPRPLLSRRLPRAGEQTAIVLDERQPGVGPLRELMRQAGTTPAWLRDAPLAGRVAQTLLDLLVLSLETHDPARAGAEQDLYGRIMAYVQRHLAEPDLDVERLARAHHVSIRTVTRAFARHQTSPMAAVWQARLQASREAIECGRVRSVSQAALESGFSDFSHFSHAFRRAFGVAPLSLLRRP